MSTPYLSIVIPVYNESESLEALVTRLYAVLESVGQSYEIIFVDDGSQDQSPLLLKAFYARYPEQIRVIQLGRNVGQHLAIMAGFEYARGEVIVTLDADLQNPPEEIPKLIAAISAGHDYVGGVRKIRQDSWFRRIASKLNNYIRAKVTGIVMTDQGSMLCAYQRRLVEMMLATEETNLFIPALAYSYASDPLEVVVEHHPREAGQSKYNLYQLLRLNFDLMTGFSLVPLQLFTLFGMLISLGSTVFMLILLLRRLFIGPEVEGVFTLIAILYFLLGVTLMGLGIIGEYVGRIYNQVRKRPRFIVREILEN